MTKLEFISACESRLIDVGIALESDDIQDALIARDDEKVIEILDTEF